MRLRTEISSRAIKDGQVPHPDHWIAAHMPDDLRPVSDDHAYWHGCAKCAWELKQHKRINREAQQVIDLDDRMHSYRSPRGDRLQLI